MSPLFIAILVLLGTVSGFFAGMLGIGGGILLVPFLAWLFAASGFPPDHVLHMAVATSLATIFFTSVSSIRAHHGHGAVRWDLLRSMGTGAIAGTFVGAQFASRIGTRWLAVVFAMFIGYLGVDMMRNANRAPPSNPHAMSGVPALFGVGGGIGFVASLIGAGGGFLTVPFLQWHGVTIREAVGTSAAMGCAIAMGGLVGYMVAGSHLSDMPPYTIGYIDLPALALCSVASVPMAPVGVRTAHAMKQSTLKTIFATLLIGAAASMAWKAWKA